jgi:predicted DNA-binding protein (UPF0278 family)
MNNSCINEKINCVFNKKTKKCVKPNPYIEYISYCKKKGIPFHITKKTYNENKEEIKKDACKYHLSNKNKVKTPLKPEKPEKAALKKMDKIVYRYQNKIAPIKAKKK